MIPKAAAMPARFRSAETGLRFTRGDWLGVVVPDRCARPEAPRLPAWFYLKSGQAVISLAA